MNTKESFIVDSSIKLNSISLEHVNDVYNIIDNQREYLGQWLPFVEHTTSRQAIKEFVESVVYFDDGIFSQVFVVFFKDTICGIIGFKETDIMERTTEVGYWLSQEYQHKGIVTKSVSLLVNYAFEDLELRKVFIRCAVGNDKSKAIPLRLGFDLCDIETESETLSSGEKVDLEVYMKKSY